MENGLSDLMKIIDQINGQQKAKDKQALRYYGDPNMDPYFGSGDATVRTYWPAYNNPDHWIGKINEMLDLHYGTPFSSVVKTTQEKKTPEYENSWRTVREIMPGNALISYGAKPRDYADLRTPAATKIYGVTTNNPPEKGYMNYKTSVDAATIPPLGSLMAALGFKKLDQNKTNIDIALHEVIHNALNALPSENYPFKTGQDEEDFTRWYTQKLAPNAYHAATLNEFQEFNKWPQEKLDRFEKLSQELQPIFQKMIKDRRPGGPR